MSRVQQPSLSDEYQGAKLTHYEASVAYISRHKNEYIEAVIDYLKDRVKRQHVSLLSNILAFLLIMDETEHSQMICECLTSYIILQYH